MKAKRIPAGTIAPPHQYDHHDAPVLAGASEITRRAIAIVGAGTLYTFLHLETLTADDLPAVQRRQAKSKLDSIEAEHAGWQAVASHIEAARVALRDRPQAREHGLRITHPDLRQPVELLLVDILELVAGGTSDISRRFLEVDVGDEFGIRPGKLATARTMVELARSFRKASTNSSVRLRLLSLLDALREWPIGDAATLIISSQEDWDPPPVAIAPKYMFRVSDLESRDPAVATRARTHRAALLQWIRDQRKVPVRERPNVAGKRKRRRKRES